MTTVVPLDEAPEHRESYGPDRQMWVIRYTRDGQPREIHARRSEHTRGEIHAVCRSMATDTGAPVAFTAADIGGTYGWRLVSEGRDPLWYVVEPQGWKRARRVEACPNGCGGSQP